MWDVPTGEYSFVESWKALILGGDYGEKVR